MASKASKGLATAVAALIIGLFISAGRSANQTVIIAILTVIAMVWLVNRYVTGTTKEVFITGFVLGVIDSYVFLIQPNYPGAPELPGAAELFFGVAAVTRVVILLLEMIPSPLQKSVRRLVAA